MKTSLVSGPAKEPLVLNEIKDHMRIERSIVDEDEFLTALIPGARQYVEIFTRRKLITQTWKLFLVKWPDENYIELPFGALQTVTSVKYKDTDAVEYTLSSSDYTVDNQSLLGRIILEYGETWPGITLHPNNPIYIEFVCGYAAPGAVAWQASKEYNIDDQVIPVSDNGLVYACTVAGTSHTGEPTWPTAVGDTVTDNTVTWICRGVVVPQAIRIAMKILIAHFHENREPFVVGQTIMQVPMSVESLLWPYRILRF